MSPEALQVAVEALESERSDAAGWRDHAQLVLGQAVDNVEQVQKSVQDAEERVRRAEEALEGLRAMLAAQTGAEGSGE